MKVMRAPYHYLLLMALIAIPTVSHAGTKELSISQGDVFLSPSSPVTSVTTRIYATVHNTGTLDALAAVRFSNRVTGEQIGADQPISLIAGKTDDVFVDWRPESGNYTIFIQVIPWDNENDDPSNNTASIKTFVDRDSDKDGVGNQTDIDDDNDGVPDLIDLFPLNPTESADTDGDGLGNNADLDDDNDNVPDDEDAFPLDPLESVDSDGDGLGDNADGDDDNDGLGDLIEDANQNGKVDKGETDPKQKDTDGDGVNDGDDAFPLDPLEQNDFDGDGIGDNKDIDDDDDGILDASDVNPLNAGPVIEVKDEVRSVGIGNSLVIDTTPSTDPDGEIVQTIIVVERITDDNSIPENTQNTPSSLAPPTPSANNPSLGDTSGTNPTDTLPATDTSIVTTNDNAREIAPPPANTQDSAPNQNPSPTTVAPTGISGAKQSDETINLSSIDQILALYFKNYANITHVEENGEELSYDDGRLYSFIGQTFTGSFSTPGVYRITVIAQDDKNETRSKEIIVNVRDYPKIFKTVGFILLLLLAILGVVKYILRASARNKISVAGKGKPKKAYKLRK